MQAEAKSSAFIPPATRIQPKPTSAAAAQRLCLPVFLFFSVSDVFVSLLTPLRKTRADWPTHDSQYHTFTTVRYLCSVTVLLRYDTLGSGNKQERLPGEAIARWLEVHSSTSKPVVDGYTPHAHTCVPSAYPCRGPTYAKRACRKKEERRSGRAYCIAVQ